MAITQKDLLIINQALAQYEALLDDCSCRTESRANCDNPACMFHKEDFGNPEKTINATRVRILQEIMKRENKKVGA